MADSEATWAKDIVIDPELLKTAADIRAAAGSKKLAKFEIVLALSEAYQIGAQRGDAAQDPLSAFATAITPIPKPKITNERYNILAKIVEQLPEDFWYGKPATSGGQTVFVPSAVQNLDITPYLNALATNEDAPSVNQDALNATISKVKEVVDAEIEMAFTSIGVSPTDPRVTSAKNARGMSTLRPSPENITGASNQPIQVGSPSGQTAANIVPIIPAQEGDFSAQAANAMVGAPTGATPQEFLQQDASRTIQDLYNTFGNEVDLNFEGMVSSGRVGDLSSTALGAALNYPYQLDREGVQRLQKSLAQAGYFDQVGNIYSTFGTVDNYTKLAWDMFLVDSVKKGINPGKHLDERIRNYAGERRALEGIQFQDQAALEVVANDLGEKLMGRRLQWGELQSFLQNIRAWETKAASGPSYAQSTESIDISSKALQYFERQYRSEIAKTTADDLMAKLNPNYYGKVNVGG